MTVRPFADSDLAAAGEIACALWQGEIPELPAELGPRLYAFLVRYYCRPGSPFHLAALDEEKRLCGFLLAAPPEREENTAAEEWFLARLQNEEEKRFFREYRAYLESNRLAELRESRPGDLLLLLFCSIRRGTGKLLLREMEKRARAAGKSSFFLWTDETCDFDYYDRRHFRKTAHFPCGAALCGHRFDTYLFRKMLDEN